MRQKRCQTNVTVIAVGEYFTVEKMQKKETQGVSFLTNIIVRVNIMPLADFVKFYSYFTQTESSSFFHWIHIFLLISLRIDDDIAASIFFNLNMKYSLEAILQFYFQ